MEAGLVLSVQDNIQDQQLPIITVVVIAVVPAVATQANAEVILPACLRPAPYLLQPITFLPERRLLFRDMFELMPGVPVRVQPVMFQIVPGPAVVPITGILIVSGLPEEGAVGPVAPVLLVLVVAMDAAGMVLIWSVVTTLQSPLAALKHTVPETWAPILIIFKAETAADAPVHKLLLLMFRNLSPTLMSRASAAQVV